MSDAVLLLSGGLDSSANLALGPSSEKSFRVRIGLTVDYGQRGARAEIERAAKLCAHFNVEHQVFDFKGFKNLAGGSSALMNQGHVPSPTSLDEMSVITESAKAVWVPNRNGILISLAAALAEARKIPFVAVGFNAEEAVTFPDNTEDYMSAMTGSLAYSTANQVSVVSATSSMTKKEIVERLVGSRFPFELLWSCYQPGPRHCGECESCQRLRRALSTGLPASEKDKALKALFG